MKAKYNITGLSLEVINDGNGNTISVGYFNDENEIDEYLSKYKVIRKVSARDSFKKLVLAYVIV